MNSLLKIVRFRIFGLTFIIIFDNLMQILRSWTINIRFCTLRRIKKGTLFKFRKMFRNFQL